MSNTIQQLREFIKIYDSPDNEPIYYSKINKIYNFVVNLSILRVFKENRGAINTSTFINLDVEDIQILVDKYKPILKEMECKENERKITSIEYDIARAQKELEKRKANICI